MSAEENVDNLDIVQISREAPEFAPFEEIISKQWGESEIQELAVKDDTFDVRDPDIYILKKDDDIIGGMILHEQKDLELCPLGESYLFLSYLIVRDDMRGKGFGTKLLNHAGEIQEDLDMEIYLYAESWNEPSKRFYEKNGFMYRDEVDGVYTDNAPGPTTAILYYRGCSNEKWESIMNGSFDGIVRK